MPTRARVYQNNGYYPSPAEMEAAIDGDARLRAQGILSAGRSYRPEKRGQLWERVRESGEVR